MEYGYCLELIVYNNNFFVNREGLLKCFVFGNLYLEIYIIFYLFI